MAAAAETDSRATSEAVLSPILVSDREITFDYKGAVVENFDCCHEIDPTDIIADCRGLSETVDMFNEMKRCALAYNVAFRVGYSAS